MKDEKRKRTTFILRCETSKEKRKTRGENGGKFDGPNNDTPLGDFMRIIHKLPDQRKVDGE